MHSISQKIKILSCESNVPIDNVYMIKGHFFSGEGSNEKGELFFPKKWENLKVTLHKLGYEDTTIFLQNSKEICLNSKTFKLREVEINSQKLSVKEELEKFIKVSSRNMKKKRTTRLYDFKYEIYLPEKGSQESHSGFLNLVTNGYNKKAEGWWFSTFCTLKSVVDSGFWNSAQFEEFRRGRFITFMNADGMRKGRFLKKRFKESTFSKSMTPSQYNFEILSIEEKQKNRYLIRVSFNYDSLITDVEYRWLSRVKEERNSLALNGSWNSFYTKWTYTTDNNATFASLYGEADYKTEGGVLYTNKIKLNLTNKKDIDSCRNYPIFILSKKKMMKRNDYKVNYK